MLLEMRKKKIHQILTIGFQYIYVLKEGSFFVLFCTYEIHQTGMFQIVFLVSLESSRQGGVVHGLASMMFGLAMQKVLEY